MQNQELDDILGSLQQIVRQAYALGRSEALKQVVEVLKADASSANPLALLGPTNEAGSSVTPPSTESAAPPQDHAPLFKPSNDDHDATAASARATPWWMREPRAVFGDRAL